MLKKISVAACLLLCVSLLSFGFNKPTVKTEAVGDCQNQEVVTVAKTQKVKSGVLNSRFLNMLNHSFVYDNDFESEEVMVNNSVLALLDLAQDGFVAQNYVSDYIFNMYGVNITDFSGINVDFEQKQGYVYVIPRGYSVCEHQIKSVTDNEDGSYTVVTGVEISLDDGSIINDTATTIFLRNDESHFGFNIVYSEIGAEIENALDC